MMRYLGLFQERFVPSSDVTALEVGQGDRAVAIPDRVVHQVAERSFEQAAVVVGLAVGLGMGRRANTNPPIARLLSAARASTTLPEHRPTAILSGHFDEQN